MVVPNDLEGVLLALRRVVGGDTSALSLVGSCEHARLRDAASATEIPLVVSRSAVVSILRGLLQRSLLPEQAQCWASFVRRGYLANRTGGPIQPLDIVYEEAWEEDIAAAVSRLDEIGDAVDGDLTRDELLDLLLLLGETDL